MHVSTYYQSPYYLSNMKTITKVYNLYTFDELSKEAQEKAHETWKAGNDYPFMSDCMNEQLHELLEEKGITDTNDTSKPGTKPTQVFYSLAYCQGDGAMFEGDFIYKGYNVHVKHSGHYYHSNSKDITITDNEGNDIDGQVYEDFDALYKEICDELEEYGYKFMEYEDSIEAFQEACEANEYTFTTEGVMENE